MIMNHFQLKKKVSKLYKYSSILFIIRNNKN